MNNLLVINKNKIIYIASILMLITACLSTGDNALDDISPNIGTIKVRLIKEGTGHKPSDGIEPNDEKNIIIGPEKEQFAAAVFDYYENSKIVINGIKWSTINKNNGTIPLNLHIHKHDDSYIVLVNLDYNEKNDVNLIIKATKNEKLMAQKEIIVKKRVSPIQKTIEVSNKNGVINADEKIEINPNNGENAELTFKFVVEGKANTTNVNWAYTDVNDGEIELPPGVIFEHSKPPLTGFFIFKLDKNTYNKSTKFETVVVLKQDKLRLERVITILDSY